MINEKEGKILIDKKYHPNFPNGGTLPPGAILIPYTKEAPQPI